MNAPRHEPCEKPSIPKNDPAPDMHPDDVPGNEVPGREVPTPDHTPDVNPPKVLH